MGKQLSEIVYRGFRPKGPFLPILREVFSARREKIHGELPEGEEVMTGRGSWPLGVRGLSHGNNAKAAQVRSIYGLAVAEGGGVAVSGGDYTAGLATGPGAVALGTGECGLAVASGFEAVALALGTGTRCATETPQAVVPMGGVAIALGDATMAKGEIGDWLILAERGKDRYGRANFRPIRRIRAVRVDGWRIKPDTFYEIRHGMVRKVREDAPEN